ncbi:hypothetical protein VE25_07495 [Devosia geojensis]|uniref:Uncharacterized protein n=1 Tax=Devosia geojensis TaxID=443610 RepID=A0A0F5FW14_9HYPH|nr:hypothetical protein [Devosia geojensis]KKB12387.1 hypothetical protein VE25_07495 [Devosia geojensis]
MITQTNSTARPSITMPALPGDNRDERTRYFGDVWELARMASILEVSLERALSTNRAIRHDKENGIRTLNFADSAIEDILFAIGNICERAELLHARAYLFEGEGA